MIINKWLIDNRYLVLLKENNYLIIIDIIKILEYLNLKKRWIEIE